ncbi:hypothetical protein [Rickettsia endosymbiont of Orchestes rusci]|uniref:hypothetical protein n=1 Tax=Rickettsia endosymbiont of Orchestes rusci TaxID=3066250 RepID=UPI00313CCCDB
MTVSFINLAQFAALTDKQKAELQKLSDRANNVAKATAVNLKEFRKKMHDILRNSLVEFSETEKIDIEKLFDDTIGKAQDALLETIENTYQGQLKTTDIFLFDGVVAEKILSVLKKILEFEEALDKMYPGASKAIIESLETLLIGVISTQLPLVGTLIKMSGIFDKINNVIDHENLLPKVKKWHKDIQTMQEKIANNEKLGGVYQKAEQTAEVAEKAEVAPHKVATLNLNKDSLKETSKKVFNDQEKKSINKVVEASESMPKSKKEVEKTISDIKNDLEKIIPTDIDKDKLMSAKKIISENLTKATVELAKVVNPQTSFAEKVAACCEAANNIKEIAGEITKIAERVPGGKELVSAINSTVKRGVETILPKKIVALKELAPVIASIAGIGKAIIIKISKAEIPSQSRRK